MHADVRLAVVVNDWRDSPYRCEVCGLGLGVDDPGTCRRMSGWFKKGSQTVRHAGPPTAYAHAVCLDTKDGAETAQETLF
jgi:hypothetical protein